MELDFASLLRMFVAEATDNLAVLEQSLLALENAPEDAELIATLFRAVHTLKGNADSLNLPILTATAHAVEDVLGALRARRIRPTRALVSLLLESHDAMLSTMQAETSGRVVELDRDLAARLARAADGAAATLARASAEEASPRAADDVSNGAKRTLRVDLERLDAIVTALEELAIAQERLRADVHRGDAADALADMDRHFDAVREQIMALRLVEVGPSFRAQARVVRDLAQATGKSARLVVEADGVEVDASVLEALRDPLTHMIRNAIDHGIEPGDVRAPLGKSAVGTIAIRARRESAHVVVELSDDGAGLDRARIVGRARTLGWLRGDGADLGDADVFRFILAHGFSTAETVTDLSGRGVGMDVVARAVAALRGSLDLASSPGAGTTITMRLPLTLSIVDGFTVEVGDQSYVVPLESVRECVELPSHLRADGEAGILSLRGAALPYVHLRSLFQLGGARPATENVVVVEHDGQRAGLAVDTLRGRSQAVTKPLTGVLRAADGVTGTTLLGDGRVGLILDVAAIFRQVVRRQAQGTVAPFGES